MDLDLDPEEGRRHICGRRWGLLGKRSHRTCASAEGAGTPHGGEMCKERREAAGGGC